MVGLINEISLLSKKKNFKERRRGALNMKTQALDDTCTQKTRINAPLTSYGSANIKTKMKIKIKIKITSLNLSQINILSTVLKT